MMRKKHLKLWYAQFPHPPPSLSVHRRERGKRRDEMTWARCACCEKGEKTERNCEKIVRRTLQALWQVECYCWACCHANRQIYTFPIIHPTFVPYILYLSLSHSFFRRRRRRRCCLNYAWCEKMCQKSRQVWLSFASMRRRDYSFAFCCYFWSISKNFSSYLCVSWIFYCLSSNEGKFVRILSKLFLNVSCFLFLKNAK